MFGGGVLATVARPYAFSVEGGVALRVWGKIKEMGLSEWERATGRAPCSD